MIDVISFYGSDNILCASPGYIHIVQHLTVCFSNASLLQVILVFLDEH